MEDYRKLLIKRIRLLSALVLFTVSILIFNIFFVPDTSRIPKVYGFQCSLVAALGTIAVITITRFRKILHNDSRLQMQYNKEHDERMKTIRSKAGLPLLQITSVLMISAGIIFSYTNIVIFYTLIIAAAIQLAIACTVKFTYMRLM